MGKAKRPAPPARGTGLTPKKRAAFIEVLRAAANVTAAAKAIGMSREAVYKLRHRDAAWADAWDNAIEEAVDTLEQEARRRAFHGVEEPVHYQGARVDTVLRYSDTLMIFLLKAHRPEKYRERFEHSGPGGGPIPHAIKVTFIRPKASEGDNSGD